MCTKGHEEHHRKVHVLRLKLEEATFVVQRSNLGSYDVRNWLHQIIIGFKDTKGMS